MASTPIELGALLDRWVSAGQAGVVETPAALTVSRLDAALARELALSGPQIGWEIDLQDSAGEPIALAEIEDDLGPFIGTVRKDVDGADRRILTCSGLAQALRESPEGGIWHVACSQIPFSSGTTSFNPWGAGDVFSPSAEVKSPLDIVREASEARLVPADIRKWLLRSDVTEVLWSDLAFQIFAEVSAPILVRSLATEVSGKESLIFSGPPRLNLPMRETALLRELEMTGYRHLRAAVAWVYEDRASTEQRHALLAAEIARSVKREEKIGEAFQKAGKDILEGARLAFQLSQSDLSREAIKAQADLRKAIADDTAKAAESTRTLSGAIAVAIATGTALVAARSTGQAEPWVLSVVACVVAGYLAVVALSGWLHLRLQSQLREQWRRRFYRFVPADDYEAMVTEPARAAERPYHLVAAVAVIVALVLGWMAYEIGGSRSFKPPSAPSPPPPAPGRSP